MRSYLKRVLELASVVIWATSMTPLFAQERPLAFGPTNGQVFSYHASYQARLQGDFVTPIVLRAVLTEATRNPNANYERLINQAVEARSAVLQDIQLAQSGHLPDPFEQEKKIVDLAARGAAFSKNPIVKGMGDVAKLALDAGSLVTEKLTRLDATQQLELKDILYTKAYREMDKTFAQAYDLAAANPRLKVAIDTILRTSIGVETGDSVEQMKRKSPALFAAMGIDRIQDMLRSKVADPETLQFIKAQLAKLASDDSKAAGDVASMSATLKAIRDEQELNKKRTALAESWQRELRSQREVVEASRSVLGLASTIIGTQDPIAANNITLAGNAVIRSWESIQSYTNAVLMNEATAFSSVLLVSSLANNVFGLVSMFSPHGDANGAILQSITALRAAISSLYEMSKQRFDRLETLLEQNQRVNLDALRLILIQGELNADQLQAVRQALAAQENLLRITGDTANDNAKGNYQATFLDRQRRCIDDAPESTKLGFFVQKDFSECLLGFVHDANDVSQVSPYTDVRGNYFSGAFDEDDALPYYALNSLFGVVFELTGRTKSRSSVVSNPLIWSNASRAFSRSIATSSQWSALVPAGRVRALEQRGMDIESDVRSLLLTSENVPDKEIFEKLLERYRQGVLSVAREVKNIGAQYAAAPGHTDGINPLARTRSPDNDADVRRRLPARIPICDRTVRNEYEKDEPDFIELPAGIENAIPDEMRVTSRLDPPGHQIGICFQVLKSDFRSFSNTSPEHWWYYFAPVLNLQFSMRDTEDSPLVLTLRLPDMYLGPWMIGTYHAGDHDQFKYMGEFQRGQTPESLKWTHSRYPYGFIDWMNAGNLSKFAETCTISWKIDGKLMSFGKGDCKRSGSGIRHPKLEKLIDETFAQNRVNAEIEVVRQAHSAGPLSTAIHELSRTKRELKAMLLAAFPISARMNRELELVIARDLTPMTGNLEFLSLSPPPEFDNNVEVQRWTDDYWYSFEPAGASPKAVAGTSEEVRIVRELAAVARKVPPTMDYTAFGPQFEQLSKIVTTFSSARSWPEEDPLIRSTLATLRAAVGKRPAQK